MSLGGKEKWNFVGVDKPRKRVDEHCVLVLLGLDGKTGTQTTEGGYQATGN